MDKKNHSIQLLIISCLIYKTAPFSLTNIPCCATETVGETNNHCVINSSNQSQAIKPCESLRDQFCESIASEQSFAAQQQSSNYEVGIAKQE